MYIMGAYCYDLTLKAGDKCILVVDDVNSPTGTWWGTITSVDNDNYEAQITEGPFKMKEGFPIFSSEEAGVVPHVNYSIYPNNEATRTLFNEISEMKKQVSKKNHEAQIWEKTHKQTMEHLLKQAAIFNKKDTK